MNRLSKQANLSLTYHIIYCIVITLHFIILIYFIMPGLMNGSKKARNINSVTNRTSIYGDLGGLVTTVGRRSSNRSAIRNKGTNNIVMPVPGLGPAGDVTIAGVVVPVPANSGTTGRAYMMGQNPTGRYMMSRNPACSGGVGRRPVYVCNNTDSKHYLSNN